MTTRVVNGGAVSLVPGVTYYSPGDGFALGEHTLVYDDVLGVLTGDLIGDPVRLLLSSGQVPERWTRVAGTPWQVRWLESEDFPEVRWLGDDHLGRVRPFKSTKSVE